MPRRAVFEVTHGCNFSCAHCYGPFRKPMAHELDFIGIRKTLEKLAYAGILHLSLTGGEPFTRPDFLDIVGAARELRFSVLISTNGSMITDEKIRRLAELKPTRVAVSLYGTSEKTYRAVTGRRGMLGRTAAAIDGLLENKINTTLAMPVIKENLADVPAAVEFAEYFGLQIKISTALTGCADGSESPLPHELSPAMNAKLAAAGIIKIKRVSRTKENVCSAGLDSPAISPDGLAYPCLEIRRQFADLKKDDFADAWQNSPILTEIRNKRWQDFPVCFKCEFFEYCLVCPAEASKLNSKRKAASCRRKKTLEKILP